ncbi:MAG: hypothetical protein HZB50_03305 [Chloroflexi bacterium]|nr:hypothetical protein [Chloroflexota bacterium]
MNKNDLSKSPKKTNNKDEQNKPNAMVRGLPGYRTRDGRSGYDPIDTRAEAAHSAGTIIQKLFTGRTRNPFHLFLLGALGLALITPPHSCNFRNAEWKSVSVECMGNLFGYRRCWSWNTDQLH